jgi:hypothetical protein
MIIQAQQRIGIEFKNDLSWSELLSKAKSNYKYIFVALDSLNCSQCMTVENQVYSNKDVVDFMASEYISVHANLDSVSVAIRAARNYPFDESAFRKKYKIGAIPAYLFFSPDGQLVHRDENIKTFTEFLSLANQALNADDQYYTVIRNYAAGFKDYSLLGPVILHANTLKDHDTANKLAVDYKANYLNHLSDSELCRIKYFNFFSRYLKMETTSGRFFLLCLKHPDMVDKETYKGYGEKVVCYFINKEEIEDKIWLDKKLVNKPDWNKLQETIASKYGFQYMQKVIPSAKLTYYKRTKDWTSYAKEVDVELRANPPKPGEGLDSDAWKLNGYAWDVFLSCDNKSVLEKALTWSNWSMQLEYGNIQYLDTKANLLYKLGYLEKAIEVEEKAISEGKKIGEWNGTTDTAFLDEYRNTVIKMKSGQPTWKGN